MRTVFFILLLLSRISFAFDKKEHNFIYLASDRMATCEIDSGGSFEKCKKTNVIPMFSRVDKMAINHAGTYAYLSDDSKLYKHRVNPP